MSDWHFGMDYDMWLYPPVDWTLPDYDYELPEPIEAANIEGTMLVNAEDAIYQVRHLQTENAKLRELALKNWYITLSEREALREHDIDSNDGTYIAALDDTIATAKDRMRELGIEVEDV